MDTLNNSAHEISLLDRVRLLSAKYNLSLYRKIQAETNHISRKSFATESSFGLFFDAYCDDLKYDCPIFEGNNLTPDWIVTSNGQTIIAEVYRLNASNEEQEWQFELGKAIQDAQKKYPGLPISSPTRSIQYKPERFHGENGRIVMKAEKYGKFVQKESLPYIICVELDMICGLDLLNVYSSLYGYPMGSLKFNIDEHQILSSKHELREDSLFYKAGEMKDNVSGVLVKYYENFYYYNNYNACNRLNPENQNWLAKFNYVELP